MALHELMTNAIRYGALKQSMGASLSGGGRRPCQKMASLGFISIGKKAAPPLDAKPQGSGQGRELIERVLPYQFSARRTFPMEEDGVHCTISLPASEHKVTAHPSVS